jgi:hypothetical protein
MAVAVDSMQENFHCDSEQKNLQEKLTKKIYNKKKSPLFRI